MTYRNGLPAWEIWVNDLHCIAFATTKPKFASATVHRDLGMIRTMREASRAARPTAEKADPASNPVLYLPYTSRAERYDGRICEESVQKAFIHSVISTCACVQSEAVL